MYKVSEAIFVCLYSTIESIVCILCRRSANLIKITRTSSFKVRIIFLKFSACMDAFRSFWTIEILVNPSTSCATFGLNKRSISSTVIGVSSTTSCNKAAAIEVAPRPISEATIFATAIGWNIYASPDLRLCSLWASTATSKAFRISFLSVGVKVW